MKKYRHITFRNVLIAKVLNKNWIKEQNSQNTQMYEIQNYNNSPEKKAVQQRSLIKMIKREQLGGTRQYKRQLKKRNRRNLSIKYMSEYDIFKKKTRSKNNGKP